MQGRKADIQKGMLDRQPIREGQTDSQTIRVGQTDNHPIRGGQTDRQPIRVGQTDNHPIRGGQTDSQSITGGQTNSQPIRGGQIDSQSVRRGQATNQRRPESQTDCNIPASLLEIAPSFIRSYQPATSYLDLPQDQDLQLYTVLYIYCNSVYCIVIRTGTEHILYSVYCKVQDYIHPKVSIILFCYRATTHQELF